MLTDEQEDRLRALTEMLEEAASPYEDGSPEDREWQERRALLIHRVL